MCLLLWFVASAKGSGQNGTPLIHRQADAVLLSNSKMDIFACRNSADGEHGHASHASQSPRKRVIASQNISVNISTIAAATPTGAAQMIATLQMSLGLIIMAPRTQLK
jgi:hypothetical protein